MTKNEAGEAEAPTLTRTPPGVDAGEHSEATASRDEVTIGVSAYPGWGGGVSVTIQVAPVVNAVAASPTCGCDFNTNQHGIGAWQ